MKALLSAVALSAFMASAAMAGEPVPLTNLQMDGISAGIRDITVSRNNVAFRAGVITQNSGNNSFNTNGGVAVVND